MEPICRTVKASTSCWSRSKASSRAWRKCGLTRAILVRGKRGSIATLTGTAFHDLLFVGQTFFGLDEFARQLIEIGTTDITQLHSLEIVPDPLIRVEIGGIAGQLFQMQPFGRSSLEKGLDLVRPVNRRAIPDEDDLDGYLA